MPLSTARKRGWDRVKRNGPHRGTVLGQEYEAAVDGVEYGDTSVGCHGERLRSSGEALGGLR